MASTSPLFNVSLLPEDVPGAQFIYPDVDRHSVVQLKRWLECRGLSMTGTKTELVERCQECIRAQQDTDISISIDNGKWYQIKVQDVLASLNSSSPCSAVTQTPTPPITGWKAFPSGNIPPTFSYGDIYQYIIASARLQPLPQVTPINDGDDDDDQDNTFSTAKPTKKGRAFFKSGHIQNIQTCSKNEYYYLKCECLPSYRLGMMYHVHVTLDNFAVIQDASCDCVGSATGRCSHIAGLLFALEDYTVNFGYTAPSCTSFSCSWNKPRNKTRNPQPAHTLQYSKKRAPNRVIDHDPCPVADQSHRADSSFATAFISSALALDTNTSWQSILEITYDDYELSNDLKLHLMDKCDVFIENVKESISEYVVGPCEVPGTVGQAISDQWHNARWYRVTASICKDCSMVSTDRGRYRLLSSHVWGIDCFNTVDMRYGSHNEKRAFEDYSLKYVETFTCLASGFWINSKYPELGCSPDGILQSLSTDVADGVLEIKCPSVLENINPTEAKEKLTKKQYYSFCSTFENGRLKLKRNHKYYFQCQMQMAICEKSFCDFVIWSPEGMSVERIPFNKLFWEQTYRLLKIFYKNILVPEIFEMRVPRKLLPFDLSK
ncbi:uncharacterized protein [Haliotis cracherodii]|uniref:uncharacterized protein n=1 Tax=Haliotis cracherodii TaxID=6455 RepID=UPI0039E9C4D6